VYETMIYYFVRYCVKITA